MPKRIQRKRARGWRLPENCIYVGRPTKWGNPYIVGTSTDSPEKPITAREAVERYRVHLLHRTDLDISELSGKDLCCWCRLDQPCHADVLLALANPEPDGATRE